MCQQTPATPEYIRVIREHVIRPLSDTPVGESCYAAVLMICGAIDGLGRLTHPDGNARAGERFKAFLYRLGQEYTTHADALWDLRNALAHNALNVACFLSKTDDARGEHLETYKGNIFVHTRRLVEDFERAVDRLEREFAADAQLLARAEARLDWNMIDGPGWRNVEIAHTPPPGPFFVQQRD